MLKSDDFSTRRHVSQKQIPRECTHRDECNFRQSCSRAILRNNCRNLSLISDLQPLFGKHNEWAVEITSRWLAGWLHWQRRLKIIALALIISEMNRSWLNQIGRPVSSYLSPRGSGFISHGRVEFIRHARADWNLLLAQFFARSRLPSTQPMANLRLAKNQVWRLQEQTARRFRAAS